ncbi:radical SAM protein [Ochrobactrum sp. BD67]
MDVLDSKAEANANSSLLQPFVEWPIKLTISITHTCHNRCIPCYAGRRNKPKQNALNSREWDSLLDQLIANRITGAFIEGGEPLLLSHIFDFISKSNQAMMTWLRTHGDLIDGNIARRLKKANVGSVVVDIWGASSNTHDYLKGKISSFERAVNGIKFLRNEDIPVIMTIIMTRHNVGELQEYLYLASQIGAHSVGILRLYPLGHAREHWKELAFPLEEQMSALRNLKVPDNIRLMQSWHPNNGNCCWQSAAVNAYGDSIGCVYLHDFVNFGNVLRDGFIQTWLNPEYQALRSMKVEKSCTSCSASQHSHGGCRSTAYAFHRRWTAPDPYDEELNDGTDLTEFPE